ncbi:MAG: N-acetyl-alpha-D-glucosaminyl L-malate synthase BshA [Burkholderiales bacterium]|nr:N-acetyl-alpha-D-glucosaminyl L-malate synthase BshA [Burkholderiales bacterium]
MSRFSIGIVCLPSLGGSAVVASELAAGLADRGHDVHLIAKALPNGPPPANERLSFHRVNVPGYPLFEQPPYTVALACAIVEVARDHRLGVVHVHYAVPHATSAYLARQVLGRQAPRLITSLHGTDVLRVGSLPDYRSVTSFAVAQSDGVVVPSVFLEGEAHRLLELPECLSVEIMPNFVDTERFSPAVVRDCDALQALFEDADAPSGPLLFHVSTFRAIKRVQDVIDVLAHVRRELPARLVLVGDGPERAAAEAHASKLGLERWVRFLGKRRDFVNYLQQADVFLLPSETESFGLAALEAMSTGIPVFGYRVGGLPELVTDEVGRLVAPFDVDALAQAVLDVIRVPATQAALGRAARARALEHYRAEPALERYEGYLQRVLERAPARENQ